MTKKEKQLYEKIIDLYKDRAELLHIIFEYRQKELREVNKSLNNAWQKEFGEDVIDSIAKYSKNRHKLLKTF
jgi:hypothetical protein